MFELLSSVASGVKKWWILAAVAGIFFIGWQASSVLHDRDMARLRAEYQAAQAAVAAKNQKEAESNAQKLSEAISQRDEALRSLDRRSADAERLRQQLYAIERRLSTSDAGACQSERVKLAGCVRLLREGADLAAEGASLAVRTSADKDALARLLR